MLNTIYEEFDFQSKIKDLKNKRIKIRRYVKNSEEIKPCIQNQEIKEKIQLMQKEQIAPRKKNNGLFHSSSTSSIKSLQHDKENKGWNEQPDIRRSKGDDAPYVHERLKEKHSNPLFMSQQTSSLFSQDIQQMVLPKLVQKILNDEERNTERVLNHLKYQKLQIDLQFDAIIQDTIDTCNASRSALHFQFDQFSQNYTRNYQILKQKVREFKEISSNNLISELLQINIFYNENRIKTDNCKIKASIDYLEKEVQKKMLNLCADELHKQTYHLPLYCNSQCTFDGIRDSLKRFLTSNVGLLENQAQRVEIMNFEGLEVRPEVTTVISEDQLQVMWNKDQFKLTLDDSIQTTHSEVILCVLQISKDNIATGSADGSIQIWDVLQKKLVQTLLSEQNSSQKQAGVHTLQTIFGNFDKKNFDGDGKKYLVSGHSITDSLVNVWNLDSGEIIRSFKGHIDTITGLICFNDKQTIISSSKDCKIMAWNALRNKQIQIMEDHKGGVNCLKLVKEGFYMISGGEDKYINVYKVVYDYDSQTKSSFFQNCELEKRIMECGVVYSLNHSTINPNIVFSTAGGQINVWNIVSGVCEKTIAGNRQPVGETVVFENPFNNKKDKKYSLISLDQEGLYICNQLSQYNTPIYLTQQVNNYQTSQAYPSMVLCKKEGQMCLVIAQQQEKNILFIKIQ